MAASLKRSRVECDTQLKGFRSPQNDYSVLSRRCVSRIPLGLANLGNTCFMSAVIQVLFHLKDFRNIVIYEENLNIPCSKNTLPYSMEQDLSIVKSLRSLFLQLEAGREIEGTQSYIYPTSLHLCLKKHANELFNFQQQDAHEFLRFLLGSIQNLFVCKKQSTLESHFPLSSSGKHSEDLVEALFGGIAITKTRCLECENETSHEETFMDISLPVHGRRSISWAISDCCKREVLMGNNKYACDSCLTYTEAERYWSFLKLPPILIFHLKLFSESTKKVNKVTPCPLELKMTRWCDSKVQNCYDSYRLSAIIVHQGFSLSQGHYYAFVSSYLTDNVSCAERAQGCSSIHSFPWYCLNDTEISTISESHLMQRLFDSFTSVETPYILFYVKQV